MASQCDRILDVLRDGKKHRMEEVHQRVGFCRLNSRISELRDRGHNIVCDKTGGHYTYLLLPAPALTSEGADLVGADRSGVGMPAESSAALLTSGDLERRSGIVPFRAGEPSHPGEKTCGGQGQAGAGNAAKRVSPALSGVQLTVWSEAAA